MDYCDVFISHAQADDPSVDKIISSLEKNGFLTWTDHKDIAPGTDWESSIQNAMRSSRSGLIVVSKESLKSLACTGERQFFFDKKKKGEKFIYVVLLEPIDEMPFTLNPIQYIELYKNWDEGVSKLITQIYKDLSNNLDRNIESVAVQNRIKTRLYANRDEIEQLPFQLIGRNNELEAILHHIKENHSVYIQAHGGAGKTALASYVAASWLEINSGKNVLWLQSGNAEIQDVLDALGRIFEQPQAFSSGKNEGQILRNLLINYSVGLIVIDDSWNELSLGRLLKIIPKANPTVVTSRKRFPLEAHAVELQNLTSESALELLAYHSKKNLIHDEAAKVICSKLANLPFAVEIAGKLMWVNSWSAMELVENLVEPHNLTRPEVDDPEPGKESVSAILETSLNILSEQSRSAFIAFGSFPTPILTADLLAVYLKNFSKVTQDIIVQFRSKNATDLEVLSESFCHTMILNGIWGDVTRKEKIEAENSLMNLFHHGLASRLQILGTDNTYYEIHSLSYSYSASRATSNQKEKAVKCCLLILGQSNTENSDRFKNLYPIIDNVVQSAYFAYKQKWELLVQGFAWNLASKEHNVLSSVGYYKQTLTILNQAVQMASKMADGVARSVFLTSLATTYSALGMSKEAIQYSKMALSSSKKYNHPRWIATDCLNLGLHYKFARQYKRAVKYTEMALDLYEKLGDQRGISFALGNLGIIYKDLEEYDEALDLLLKAIKIQKLLKDEAALGSQWGHIGNVYLQMGKLDLALEYHIKALHVALKYSGKREEGIAHLNIGAVYTELENYQEALISFRNAQDIFSKMDSQFHLANVEKAIEYVLSKLEEQ